MKLYIKKSKRHESIGLPLNISFLLEINCLKRLTKKFKCICRKKKRHFPDLIKYNKYTKKMLLRNCGYSIHIINKNKYLRKKYKVINPHEQINCIIHNLIRTKIKHLDLIFNQNYRSQNLCINNKGELSLIDFDIAVIKNIYLSRKIKKRAELFGSINYYKKLRNTIMNILKKNGRI